MILIRKGKSFKTQADTTRINEMIHEDQVRLINVEGEHTGIVSIKEALEKAQEAGLDLVEIGDKAKPHVCRIMDYGQFKYEKAKKEKEAKKKQKKIVVKEIKLRPRIDEHDYQFKMNHAIKFLEHGDKVRFIMQFRGREMAHKELGMDVMLKVIEDLKEEAIVEQPPKHEGRFINMTVTSTGKKAKSSDEHDEDTVDNNQHTEINSSDKPVTETKED